jgi:eukaryotic-like serine/threonine-protein kinase
MGNYPTTGKLAYKLGEKLGEGGCGTVFKATRLIDSKPCAIKILSHPVTQNLDEKRLQEYDLEKTLSSTLSHPWVVESFDHYLDDKNLSCLVFDYYKEGDFAEYLRSHERKPFTEREIVRFLANMAITIHFINTRGIFHRDLKPENFLITRGNGNKVYLHMHDFGIARALESSVKHVKTDSGIVKGSTHYCSPEQLRGTACQCLGKIDTWAMGVIAYQLVAKRMPFEGFLSAQVIYAITMT